MIFKITYQPTKTEAPRRENTQALYVEASDKGRSPPPCRWKHWIQRWVYPRARWKTLSLRKNKTLNLN